MGLGKVLAIILLVIILIIGVIGVDIYLTYNALSEADLESTVSEPSYEVSDDNSTITVSIEVSLPSAGFIPKGVIITITADFSGDELSDTEEVELGETKTLSLSFTMSPANVQTLTNGGSLTVDLSALITPMILGFGIDSIAQNVDLGSQTISA